MKMGNVFGRPAREKKLTSLIKKTCSSVRNAYRQDVSSLIFILSDACLIPCQLRQSISPAQFQSLAQFTYNSALKYKRGGPGEKLDHAFTVHNVILVYAFITAALICVLTLFLCSANLRSITQIFSGFLRWNQTLMMSQEIQPVCWRSAKLGLLVGASQKAKISGVRWMHFSARKSVRTAKTLQVQDGNRTYNSVWYWPPVRSSNSLCYSYVDNLIRWDNSRYSDQGIDDDMSFGGALVLPPSINPGSDTHLATDHVGANSSQGAGILSYFWG